MLGDVNIRADRTENIVPSSTPIGYFAWRGVFHCCITVYRTTD
jgi:hypothetical protein